MANLGVINPGEVLYIGALDAVGAGNEFSCATNSWSYYITVGTGTVSIQGSMDSGANWFDMITPVTATADGNSFQWAPLMRFNCSADTSGTHECWVAVSPVRS